MDIGEHEECPTGKHWRTRCKVCGELYNPENQHYRCPHESI